MKLTALKIFIVLVIFLIFIILIWEIFFNKTLETTNPRNSFPKNEGDTIIRLGQWNNDSLNNLIQKSKKYKNEGDRIDYLSQKFVETPYGANTLIGNKNLSEKLVVDLEKVDCSTFLDYITSLFLVDDVSGFYKKLKLIRYESGQVGFEKRNHFFSQWINNNGDYFINVSSNFQNSVCLERELNKKKNGDYWVDGINPFKEYICYVPKSSVLEKKFNSNFKNGDIVGLYTNLEGLDVTHVGIISIKNSEIYFRHASSIYKKVLDEKLDDYLKINYNWDGLIIVRTRD